MTREISCPIDHVKVNENKARLVAAQVFVFASMYFVIPYWEIPALLLADFFLRSFGYSQYSPLAILAAFLIQKLGIPNKPVDQAPKIFAARIGFILADIFLILSAITEISLSYYIAGILVIFSFLESVFHFCAGCYIYQVLKRF
jgi:Domain of unknown function (DUF4395)